MRQAIVIVSFGSSVETARVQQISAVEEAIKAETPGSLAYTAYTSPTIRRILRGRGISIPSLEEALDQMLEDGITDALVQPTHLLYGIEYDKMKATVDAYAGRFASLQFGIPLLATTEDLRELAAILSEAYPRKEGEALVFLGHGTDHFANVVYPALQMIFHMQGREDVLIGTVEGWPSYEEVRAQLHVSALRMVPLMLVAGDHAIHDMAGDGEDSWKRRFEEDGLAVQCVLQGLGAMPPIQELYQNHIRTLQKGDRYL